MRFIAFVRAGGEWREVASISAMTTTNNKSSTTLSLPHVLKALTDYGFDLATAVPLDELANYLPRRNGKTVHKSTIFRWKEVGVLSGNGERRFLETFRVGRRCFTSPDHLARFLRSLSDDVTGDRPVSRVQIERAAAAHERVGQMLARDTRSRTSGR